MKTYLLSILHVVAGFTILILGFYLLAPIIGTLFSAGLTVQLLVVIVGLVLVPLVYTALGLALWIKPEGALLVTLGAHVVIGALALLLQALRDTNSKLLQPITPNTTSKVVLSGFHSTLHSSQI